MYKSAKLGLVLIVTYLQIYTLLTVRLLNNSVELFPNLYPQPLKRVDWNSAAHPILMELLSCSIGWGLVCNLVGLWRVRGSNPLKVLQQEYKVIYLMYYSAKFGLV